MDNHIKKRQGLVNLSKKSFVILTSSMAILAPANNVKAESETKPNTDLQEKNEVNEEKKLNLSSTKLVLKQSFVDRDKYYIAAHGSHSSHSSHVSSSHYSSGLPDYSVPSYYPSTYSTPEPIYTPVPTVEPTETPRPTITPFSTPLPTSTPIPTPKPTPLPTAIPTQKSNSSSGNSSAVNVTTSATVFASPNVLLKYLPDHKTNPNKEIAKGSIDNNGNFTINPDLNFKPGINEIFVLEAIKYNGLTEKDKVTVRSYIKWDGKVWSSITKPDIIINSNTTAFTLIDEFDTKIVPGDTIGKVNIIQGKSILSNIGDFSTQTISEISGKVTNILQNSLSPSKVKIFLFGYRDLMPAMEGADVKELQEILKQMGYPVSVTGKYDKETENAVSNFQKNEGLGVSGIVDPGTIQKIIEKNKQ
jgi:hypothetical protein